MAAPIYLPADPFIHAPEIPAVPERTVAFVRNTKLLLREQHGGPGWPAQLGYAGLALSTAIFIGLMALTTTNLDADESQEESFPRSDTGHRAPITASRNGSWRPGTPAPVPAARWNPGGLTRT